MKAQDGRPLAHFFSFCFLPENAFDPSCSCIFDRIKSFKDTLFSAYFYLRGESKCRRGESTCFQTLGLGSIFSADVTSCRFILTLVSFLSKSFLLGSLVYLCKRTNTPLLLPRTAQREGEGRASDPHLFRRKTCPA